MKASKLIPLFRVVIIACLIAVSLQYSLHAQNADEKTIRYKSALKMANDYFKAGKYFESIVFYKEAWAVKPDESLPRYRIEDIKTIYIQQEVEKLIPKDDGTKKSKKELKELALEKARIEQEVRSKVEKDILSMDNEEVREEAKNRILNLTNLRLDELEEKQRAQVEKDSIERKKRIEAAFAQEAMKDSLQTAALISDQKRIADSIKKARQAILLQEEEQKRIEENNAEVARKKEEAVAKIRLEEEQKKKEEQELKASMTVSDVKPGNSEEEEVIKTEETKKSISIAEARLIKQEELKKKYPERKTIETIQDPGKKTTRIIINNEGKVTVYLQVEHSWGGVFYFIDYDPDPVASISKDYFDRHTK